mmetsp:Transcript_15720/g.26223  ORF Transcript_15720/g.26223 Transcript_15720/m.26223 type:complete len:204 (+) Transcript_15720:52-663(+)
MKASFLVGVLGAGAAAASLSPQGLIEHHLQRARRMNVNSTAATEVTAGKRGSLVYLDNGDNCDKDITSAFGFTLGECVVRQNEGHGVKYASCFYDTGNVVFTITECSDEFCQEGCVDHMMVESKQCTYGPEPYNGQIVCAANVDAYTNYEQLTLTSKEYFGGDEDCSGQYGYWSSQAMTCTDDYNRSCNRGNNYYYFETVCEM